MPSSSMSCMRSSIRPSRRRRAASARSTSSRPIVSPAPCAASRTQRAACRRSWSRRGCGARRARRRPPPARRPPRRRRAAGRSRWQAPATTRGVARQRLRAHRHVGREVGADAEQPAEVGIAVPERVVVPALADHDDLDVDRHLVGLERPRHAEQARAGGADVEHAGLERALQRHPGAGHLEHLDGVDDQEPAVGGQQRAAPDGGRVGPEAHRPVLDAVDRPGQVLAAREPLGHDRRAGQPGAVGDDVHAVALETAAEALHRVGPGVGELDDGGDDVVAQLGQERRRARGRARAARCRRPPRRPASARRPRPARAGRPRSAAGGRGRRGRGRAARRRAPRRRASFAANSSGESDARSCSSGTGWPSLTGTISGCDELARLDLHQAEAVGLGALPAGRRPRAPPRRRTACPARRAAATARGPRAAAAAAAAGSGAARRSRGRARRRRRRAGSAAAGGRAR